MHQRFFSIIVPAYNEEMLIERSITCLKNLDYPKDRYEVIVIENGSTDATYEKAKTFESENIRVFHMEGKGVSRARNFGIERVSDKMEWNIILDADAFLKPSFLREVNAYLEVHPDAGYGMTTLLPDSDSLNARFWWWYRSATDRMLKTMDTVHIVRRDILAATRYEEDFSFTEDLRYTERLRRYGEYFFIKTKSLSSSTRRFEQKGFLWMAILNIWIGIVYKIRPQSLAHKDWEPVR